MLSFNGANNFINNSAGFGGGAIHAKSTVLSFSGSTHFFNDSAIVGGAMTNTNNTTTFNGTVYFTNNGHFGKAVSTVNG